VVRASVCQCQSRNSSISASSDTVESEGRQMNQCCMKYIQKEQKEEKNLLLGNTTFLDVSYERRIGSVVYRYPYEFLWIRI
jgi:hypothetical protein